MAENTTTANRRKGIDFSKHGGDFPNASPKQMTMLVTKYDNGVSTQTNKEGQERTTHWLDAQVLQTPGANEHLPRQEYPHLKAVPRENGSYDFRAPYADKQWDAIKEAGGKEYPLNDKDGNKVGSAYVVTADMIPKGNASILNTKNGLGPAPEGLDIPEDVVNAQFEAIQENRAAAKEKEAQAEAPQAEGAEAPQAEGSARDAKGRFVKQEASEEKTADEPEFA